ncbi:hypothetical protein V4Z91_003924 [Klebsiella pneumoniae]
MPAKDPAVPTDATLGYTFQNDFLALSRAFSLPDIDYHDISRREQLNAALRGCRRRLAVCGRRWSGR